MSLLNKLKLKNDFTKVFKLNLKENQYTKIRLKDIDFALQIIKKIFKNEDDSTEIFYITSNNLKHNKN